MVALIWFLVVSLLFLRLFLMVKWMSEWGDHVLFC
jgi:hypothetical protein